MRDRDIWRGLSGVDRIKFRPSSSSSRTHDYPTTPSSSSASSEQNKMKIVSSPINYDSVSVVESERNLAESKDDKKEV